MRLTQQQRQTILDTVHARLGNTARARLFGSRVDDNAIGGDVDLLIETPERISLASELSLSAQLAWQLGEPVDVIITFPGQKQKPLVELAKRTGVEL